MNEIAGVNERVMREHSAVAASDLETILGVDVWARKAAEEQLSKKSTAAAITN